MSITVALSAAFSAGSQQLLSFIAAPCEPAVPLQDHIDQDAFNKVVSAPGFDLLSRMTMVF